MEPRSDLLVFTKKEVGVLAFLLILVSLLSFTLGLRVGKSLQTSKSVLEESKEAPLHDSVETHPAENPEEKQESPEGSTHETTNSETGTEAKSETPNQGHETNDEHADTHKEAAANIADAALSKEISATKGKLNQPVARKFPAQKLSAKDVAKWTLQVGSHRTVAEAAEQVTELKRKGFDAFYIEANPQGKGIWYRVGIGVYDSKEQAEKAVADLKHKGTLPPHIVQKVTE